MDLRTIDTNKVGMLYFFIVGCIDLLWYLLKNENFSLKDIKILRPKVTKSLRISLKQFCESRPWFKKKRADKGKMIYYILTTFSSVARRGAIGHLHPPGPPPTKKTQMY